MRILEDLNAASAPTTVSESADLKAIAERAKKILREFTHYQPRVDSVEGHPHSYAMAPNSHARVGVVARRRAAHRVRPAHALDELAKADPEDWWRDVEVNLRGPFLCARAVLPGMLARRRGRIVNVTSGVGGMPGAGFSGYVVSKAALMRLTDTLAAEVAGSGVAVFAISPSLVRTPGSTYLLASPVMARWAPGLLRAMERGAG